MNTKKTLEPADKIYNRIIWDDQFNVNDFSVVILDRIEGEKEIELRSLDVEEIPMHRIITFKKNGQIVWNRKTKIDLINDSEGNDVV